MRPRVPFPVLLALTVLLAGCAGSDDGSGSKAKPSEELQTDDSLGSIRGFAVDESFAPLAGVEVGILELAGRSVTSDDEGSFFFANLPAGMYSVAASKLGFRPAAVSVEVGQGEAVEDVELVLEAIPPPKDVYIEKIIKEGYLACGFKVGTVTVSNINVCAWDTQHKPQIDFEVFGEQGLVSVLLELEWQPTSLATGSELVLDLWKNPDCIPSPCDPDVEYGSIQGESPLRLQVGTLESKITNGIATAGPTLLSSLTFTGGPSPVVVQFQQRVTHFISVFYNGEPAPEYTLREG